LKVRTHTLHDMTPLYRTFSFIKIREGTLYLLKDERGVIAYTY